MKDKEKVKRGKKYRAMGSQFELRVRKDLEEKGWIVDKWSNNLEIKKYDNDEGDFSGDIKLIPAKHKFRGIGIPMAMGTGFPDFMAYRFLPNDIKKLAEVIGVESKLTGELDKKEKRKCRWLLDNGIFSKILVARKEKVKNKIVVEYEDFLQIEKRMKR